MNKKGNKIIASIVVFIMMLTNMSTLMGQVGSVLAANINNQNSKTNHVNVQFDSYFLTGKTKAYEVAKNIGEDNTIVAQITVKNAGYLKDARVEFSDANFKISEEKSDKVASIENNVITLNQIDNGEEVTLNLPITLNINDKISVDEFNKVSKVKFTANYIDEKGKEYSIKKEISLGLKWTAKAELVLQNEVSKYIPYNINGEKGLVLQTIVKSSIKDNVLPIKNNKIEVEIPEINGVKPTEVTVYNKENSNFGENNYKVENGKITIEVTNEADENGMIQWNNKSFEEFIVTYKYPEEALVEEANVELKANASVTAYSYEERSLTNTFEDTVTLKEQLGNIVDFKSSNTEAISKGYMYANFNREEKLETKLNQTVIANISMPGLVDEIILELADKYVTEKNEYASDTYFKNVTISKENFQNILGENGKIEIYSGENLISTIENIKEETIKVDLNVNALTIKTSKPQKEGELVFNFEKAIKGESSYTKEQTQKFETIKLEGKATAKNGETTIVEQEMNSSVSLTEPTTKTELTLNNNNFSTMVENENVEIRAILKTDDINNSLYENPKITIDIPSYIEKIDVKNVQLLFEDELKINAGDANLIINPDGTKQISIAMTGKQTGYDIGSIYGGANIVINANITANNLTPSTTSKIKMTSVNGSEVVENEVPVNFVAPTGIVTLNKVSNYADNAQVEALTEDKEATLEVTTSAKNATTEIQVINNYSNVIKNVRILGRTFTTETTNADNQTALNNTFDAPMTSAINTNGFEGATIYYSENGNATQDLNIASNGWTTQVTDYSKVKSYLIVLDNYTMNTGDSLKFTYNMQIPENLKYEQTVKSMYVVYFDNIKEEQTLTDKAVSRMVTLTTGIAPTLTATLTSEISENTVVRQGQYIKFIATVKNEGTVDAENVALNITAPSDKIYAYYDENGNGHYTNDASILENPEKKLLVEYSTKHTEYKEESFYTGYDDSDELTKTITIGTLKAGETKTVEYELKIEDYVLYEHRRLINVDTGEKIELPEIALTSTVKVNADNLQKEVESNEYKLKLDNGYVSMVMYADASSNYTLQKGDELKYTVKVEEISKNTELENAVIKIKLPEGVTVEKTELVENIVLEEPIKYTTEFDKENNTQIFYIEKIQLYSLFDCDVTVKIGDIQGNIEASATLEAKDIGTHYSNKAKNKVDKISMQIKQEDLESEYVKEKEQITYKYVIKNTSNVIATNAKFENQIPEGMHILYAKVIREGLEDQIISNDNEKTFNLEWSEVNANTTITIEITMEADKLDAGTKQKEITNNAVLSGSNFESITSNSVKTIIEYNKNAHIDSDDVSGDDQVNDDEGKYSIMGTAWLDKNKDGRRDEDEELLAGIEVRLLNKETNEVIATTTTSNSGTYRFANVENGEYLVVFVYNSAKYDLTEYKKQGVGDTVNSDVINVKMTIDGKEKTVATSDAIKVKDASVRNIDMGLCESEKNDLRLDKYISSVTVTYGNKVKTYDYKDVKLAKVEIPAKELSNATVIVNYKITVTNEGAITNYIKKIVDYVPNDMKFNSELNRDWYQSTNGDLYNSSLANTKLLPGETLEVNLTLTRKMTENNTGIVNNNAEIYEVYNEEGITDMNSTPGNKNSNENDMSAADLVISVKTGDAIIYTAIISIVICGILAASAYIIRKKVLRKI